jgi:uncharacterized protein YjhX (UPF0386 family)
MMKSIRSNQISTAFSAGAAALSRESARLLSGPAQPGRYATLDPTNEGALILRCARDGVSLGGGSFPLSAAEELRRHHLVEEIGARSRRSFRISEPGLARLRREEPASNRLSRPSTASASKNASSSKDAGSPSR